MRIITSILFIVLFMPSKVWAEVLPKEGSILNYRIIGFSLSPAEKTKEYRLEIADGNYSLESAFKDNIIKTINCNEEKVIAEVPAFGKQYTWRTICVKNNSIKMGPLHHFSTGSVPWVDTAVSRVRVLKKGPKYMDSYVFSDATTALYDMNGNAVWYLPYQESYVRDLKLSPQGTITLLLNNHPIEINYSGDTLWRPIEDDDTKQGSKKNEFHHSFCRLTNGNYMTLGTETMVWPAPADSAGTAERKIDFGTVVELDSTGREIWSWNSSKYYKTTDFFSHSQASVNVHENAFYFDEKLGVIYLSFKNTNTILKIKYPEGIVLDAFGATDYASMQDPDKNLFCSQHSCSSPTPGYFYIFNNNICHPESSSKVMLMKESGKNRAVNVWDYECTRDNDAGKTQKKGMYDKGGNVIELPDSCLFVSVPFGKVFIVGRSKEVLWSADFEKRKPSQPNWEEVVLYRSSIITRKDLERLIWIPTDGSKNVVGKRVK